MPTTSKEVPTLSLLHYSVALGLLPTVAYTLAGWRLRTRHCDVSRAFLVATTAFLLLWALRRRLVLRVRRAVTAAWPAVCVGMHCFGAVAVRLATGRVSAMRLDACFPASPRPVTGDAGAAGRLHARLRSASAHAPP